MKMDRRLTNGLAWAGALLVIGIPAADYITGTFASSGTPSVAVVDASPVAAEATAVVPPAAPKPVVTDVPKTAPTPAAKPQAVASASDPVSAFQQSGKPLPSYITGGGSASTVAPAKPVTQPTVQQPTQAVTTPAPTTATPAPAEQVAALPAKAAPTPMPLSMRPQPVTVPLASNQPPLIIDQPTAAPVAPVQQQPDNLVTAQDLEDWESGPLNEFLARRGQQSSATYRVQQNAPAPAYDGNGFWLDEGPRNQRYSDDDVYYTPF